MSTERFRSPELLRVSVGRRYGRLTVVGLISDQKNPKADCICDCGKRVSPQRGALTNGRAKSCGCLRRELLGKYVAAITLAADVRRTRKKAQTKAWVDRNYERAREINRRATRRFHKNHPEKGREGCRNRRARLLGQIGNVSQGIETKLFTLQRGKCACCKGQLRRRKTHLDHIKPLSLGGLHEDANLQLLCRTCNLSKGFKTPESFMRSRGFLL